MNGDVHIAYQEVGEGPIDLVYTTGIWSNLEIIWEWPAAARYLERLASFARLILFDMRGVGLSDRGGQPPILELQADDVRAVMDTAGYDAVWLAEHHFSGFSVCPSVHMMGVMAAARTKRLRIGTAVSLAPFYNPLRLAEEVALLDVLSGGRVNWGAGRGFERSEFKAFGIPGDESASRFHEAVDIVLRACTNEKLTYAGNYYSYDGVEVLPKPLQTPHPPVWMAATSTSAIDWAAAKGFSILMDPHSSRADLIRKRRHYGEQLAAAGYSETGRVIPMARLIAIDETADKARDVARRTADWTLTSYEEAVQLIRARGAEPATVAEMRIALAAAG